MKKLNLLFSLLSFALLGVSAAPLEVNPTILASGDLALIGMDTPGEDFAFVCFVDLNAGTTIYFTDEEASGSYVIGTGEGTVMFTAPVGGIAAGEVISYVANASYFTTTSDGAMALGNSGDGLLAYQGESVGNVTTFLHAIGENLSLIGTFPDGFSNYMTFGTDDGKYSGTRNGTASELMTAINNVSNWTTSGSGVIPFTTTSFTISEGLPAPSITNYQPQDGDEFDRDSTFTVSADVTTEGAGGIDTVMFAYGFEDTELNDTVGMEYIADSFFVEMESDTVCTFYGQIVAVGENGEISASDVRSIDIVGPPAPEITAFMPEDGDEYERDSIFTISATVTTTDVDGLDSVIFVYGLGPDALLDTSLMEAVGDVYSVAIFSDTTTTVYGQVVAVGGNGEITESAINSVIIVAPQMVDLPYYEEDASPDFGLNYTYSVSGDTKQWEYNEAMEAYQMNGYNSGDTEEDWFVLPAVDMNRYFDKELTYLRLEEFGSHDENNYLKMMYSDDYRGIGDPSEAIWDELTMLYADSTMEGGTEVEVAYAGIDSIEGDTVFFALKYHYASGSYVDWKVGMFAIEGTDSIFAEVIPEDDATCTAGDSVAFAVRLTVPDEEVDSVVIEVYNEEYSVRMIVEDTIIGGETFYYIEGPMYPEGPHNFQFLVYKDGQEISSGEYTLWAECPEIEVPVATGATEVGLEQFTAHWNRVPDIDTYILEVWEMMYFNALLSYDDLQEGEPANWTNNSAYYNTGSALSGTGKGGMNDVDDWVMTDALEYPSAFVVWHRPSSAGDDPYSVVLQKSANGIDWDDVALITHENSEDYVMDSIGLGETWESTLLRMYVTAKDKSFYFDDISIYQYQQEVHFILEDVYVEDEDAYIVNGLSPSSEYYYAVSAMNEFYCTSDTSNNVWCTTLDVPDPEIISTEEELRFEYLIDNGPSEIDSLDLMAHNLDPEKDIILLWDTQLFDLALTADFLMTLSAPHNISPDENGDVDERIYIRLRASLQEGDWNDSLFVVYVGDMYDTVLLNGEVYLGYETLPYHEDFNEDVMDEWLNINTVNDEGLEWTYQAQSVGIVHAPQASTKDTVWLVSSPMDMEETEDEVFAFDLSYANLETADGLRIFYSEEYDGGDLNQSTWVEITDSFDIPATGNGNWSDTIDVSDWSGMVNIAFVYDYNFSMGATGAGAYSIDNIYLGPSAEAMQPSFSVMPLQMDFSYHLGQGPSARLPLNIMLRNLPFPVQVAFPVPPSIPSRQFGIDPGPAGGSPIDAAISFMVDENIDTTFYVQLEAGLAVGNYSYTIGIDTTIMMVLPPLEAISTKSAAVVRGVANDVQVECSGDVDQATQLQQAVMTHGVFASQGKIFIRTEELYLARIYDITGRMIQSCYVNGEAIMPVKDGIYMVSLGDQVTKVMVK